MKDTSNILTKIGKKGNSRMAIMLIFVCIIVSIKILRRGLYLKSLQRDILGPIRLSKGFHQCLMNLTSVVTQMCV